MDESFSEPLSLSSEVSQREKSRVVQNSDFANKTEIQKDWKWLDQSLANEHYLRLPKHQTENLANESVISSKSVSSRKSRNRKKKQSQSKLQAELTRKPEWLDNPSYDEEGKLSDQTPKLFSGTKQDPPTENNEEYTVISVEGNKQTMKDHDQVNNNLTTEGAEQYDEDVLF